MLHRGVSHLRPDPKDHIAILFPDEVINASKDLVSLINELGQASAREQNLGHVITTFNTFAGSDTKLYILVSDDSRTALGFLKTGPRHLFLWDHAGEQHEIQPLCLLDFFVCPSQQRKGYGRRLVNRMLEEEELEMKQVPIDRPSRLCLAFMKKHFGLERYLPQANNFVVFEQFWASRMPPDMPTRFSQKKAPLTPIRQQIREVASTGFARGARTPPKRPGLNPITWQPYD
jgi:alpha-tubulin N-acetyltransferase 1